MARAHSKFTQSDITRAVKGAFAAGAQSVRVDVDKEGKIAVIASKAGSHPCDAAGNSASAETAEDLAKLI
jgi:hypothetical protein